MGSPEITIVSASYRTDIPAFYGRWFLNRLAAGWCRVASPYGGGAYTVPLDAERVAGFVFWTRNAAPFADALAAVSDRGTPFVAHLTITGYPRALDGATIEAAAAVEQARALARAYGPRSVAWRYDPVVISSLTPAAWHRATFAHLAAGLAGAVDEVIVSFAQIYRKTRYNLDRAARHHGYGWEDPPDGAKRALLRDLASIAADRRMRLSLCGQRALLTEGVEDARCVDAERLADIAGRPVAAARTPHRRGCGCWQSRDIGAYDTCPHGCVYCYAVRDRDRAKGRLAAHDPAAAALGPAGERDGDTRKDR